MPLIGRRGRRLVASAFAVALVTGACHVADPDDYRRDSSPMTVTPNDVDAPPFRP